MPRQKKNAPFHPCEICEAPTNRPRFCSRTCYRKWWDANRHQYDHESIVAAGYAHTGMHITPVPPETIQKVAWMRRQAEMNRQEAEDERLKREGEERRRKLIQLEDTPGQFRNDEEFFPVKVERWHAQGRCRKCGMRACMEFSRYCHICRGEA